MLKTLLISYSSTLSPQIKSKFEEDFKKADKIVLSMVFAYAVLVAFITSYQYGYYMLGMVGGGLIAALSFTAYKVMAGTLMSRIIMATALTGMMAITIQQSNGLGEGHFVFFLNFAVLIRYRDILPLAILVLETVVHHVITAYCQTTGVELGGVPVLAFSWGMESEWGLVAPLMYHVLLAVIGAGIATYYIFEGNNKFLESNSVVSAIEKAAEGDLSVRADAYGDDELVSKVNGFLERLKDFISSVSGTAYSLNSAANIAADNAGNSQEQAHHQESQIAMLASSMEEMALTTQNIAQNAEQAAGSIDKASNVCDEGLELSRNFKKSIGELAGKVSVAAEKIAELDKSSSQIHSIVATIRGISEQTNLLALNAAIEAARAGEQGRGFAVVADEVRVLSQATHGSTEEITAMIDAFQTSTNVAVKNMNECADLTSNSVDESTVVADSFEQVANSIKSISDMAKQIASAAEQQTIGTQEVNRNASTIKEVAEGFLQGAQEGALQSEKLRDLARDIEQLLKRYRLS